MTTFNREQVTKLRKQFCDADQGHVFTWWDDISSKEREYLYKQLLSIDLSLLQQLIEKNLTSIPEKKTRILAPCPIINLPKTAQEIEFSQKAIAVGKDIIKSGRCAVFMAAGSGESDSGIKGIKGLFPITPVTGKSLFQLHTEKIIALRRRFEVNIPLFIMTSMDNHDETIDFFEENNNFNLPKEDLFFLPQGMLPAVDHSGNLVMKNSGKLYMSPDGHGGAIRALFNSGALDEMADRGIDYIFYLQVDNPLVKILDSVFLGYHNMAGAEISSKIVRKTDPEEKVGVLGNINGYLGVVEHSDLTKEEKYSREDDGQLQFFAGNIAIHILNVSFVHKLGSAGFKLAFHKSEKSLEHIDKQGTPVKPNGVNVIKFESFIFDALRYSNTSINLEVPRNEEFSPFRSLEGDSSPDICRKMMSTYYKDWLKQSGFHVDDDVDSLVEISPLFALDTEEFVEKVNKRNELHTKKLFIE